MTDIQGENLSSTKSPKTNMDAFFLEMVEAAKLEMNVRSDRAMSKALGQNESFISRIKTGIQSVPLAVWDTFDKYARDNNLVDFHESSPSQVARRAVETVAVAARLGNAFSKRDIKALFQPSDEGDKMRHGPMKGGINRGAKADLDNQLAAINEKLAAANEVIALLTSQLSDKERTIQILLAQASNK